MSFVQNFSFYFWVFKYNYTLLVQLHFSRAWLLYLSIFQISRAEILNFTCKPYLFDSFIWYSFQYSTLCTFTIVRSELPWESIHPQDPPSPIHPFKFRAFPLRVPAIHGIKDRGEITQISFRFFACLNGPSRNRNVEISMAEPSLRYILSPGRRAYAVHTTLLTSAHTYVSHQHAYNIRVINVWLPAFLSVSPLSHPHPVGDKVFESSSSWKRLSNFSHLTLFFLFSRFRAFLLLFASATTSLSPSWRDHVWLLNLRRDRFSGIVAIRHEVSAFLFFMRHGMRC